ncbi:MAG TPA: molybdate ABC transporter substrate-binding protein [Gemmataceae bacterium]|nr:molybdate ABC transporter substrate-binding protein [Gemmataceae bacterium]
MKRFLVFFCILLGLAGCSSKPPTVAIFAAASTQDVIKQIARDFEVQGGTPVTCSFAASSTLARQIEHGADADLFLSANERWADHLADKGLVAERRDLLANRLVVVAPAAHPLPLRRVTDLAGDDVQRLALALDPVPAGHYAREALQKAGIWEQVKGRVREAGDVRATLAIVERDEADAGIVYATDAVTSKKVQTALEVPEDLHTPIRYPLVLVRRSGGSPAARAFYDFLSGDKALSHFRKAGFQTQLATDEHR